ncbi:hypothetical protein DH2020_013659 [Rehmannia glutinosa]|uniref:MPN domain-containing protein n=1 Tax=Rehmannia glutinosa TaxID=99300 RepID=A0ABR0X6L8_REHGL
MTSSLTRDRMQNRHHSTVWVVKGFLLSMNFQGEKECSVVLTKQIPAVVGVIPVVVVTVLKSVFFFNLRPQKLVTALTELEELKPAVQAKLQELHSKQIYQLNKQQNSWKNDTLESSVEWPAIKQNWNDYSLKKTHQPVTSKYGYQGLKPHSLTKPVEEHLRRILESVAVIVVDVMVQYPSNVDLTPLQIPRVSNIQQSIKDGTMNREDDGISEQERSSLESVVQPKNDSHPIQESDSLISFETVESSSQTEIIRQPSPPPVLADVQDLIPTTTPATQAECRIETASNDASVCSEDPLQLHISTELMNSFMKLAKSNTDKNLETCGVLAGSLCQTTNEEEIFEVQDKQCLFPLGWIHTHPTQSCFMSSIDVHTHYSYQIMLPEAIAIVMAPRDSSRKHGIFRLTSGGMTVIRQCPRRGFHSHEPPSDGTPIYRHCTDIYMNPSLKFDVIDLR